MMRKDQDCPYKSFCQNSCQDCSFHNQFDLFRGKIDRMSRKIEGLQALLKNNRPN